MFELRLIKMVTNRNWVNILALSVIVLAGILLFGFRSQYLGFYADDAGFLLSIRTDMSASDLIAAIAGYVPGRNLHMVWQYLITILSGGGGVESLGRMHFLQVAVDCINAMLLFSALIIWGASGLGAFIAALTFLIAPNHGETHFWLSALPMNLISTSFVLMLMLTSGIYLKRLDTAKSPSNVVCGFVIIYSVYLCAIFTYDQTSPIALFLVSLFCFYCAKAIKKMKIMAIVLWLIFIAMAASIIVWKAINPGGGPGFSHLTFHHIFTTFIQSLFIWIRTFSLPFNPFVASNLSIDNIGVLERFFPLMGLLTPWDIAIVTFLAILSMGTVYFLARLPQGVGENKFHMLFQRGGKACWQLVIGGSLFFLLAYLPGYLWFLSPRHSYLPSIGVAIIISGIISAIPSKLLIVRSVAILLAGVFGYIWIGFFSANLVEKEYWISSYKIREQMYKALEASFPGVNSAILLIDFPNTPIDGAPQLAFLTGESGQAIPIITGQKVSFENFVLHPVPAKNGYFMRTEEGRWGKDSLGFMPDKNAIALQFHGYDGKRLNYSVAKGPMYFSTDKYYSLKSAAPRVANDAKEFSAIRTSHGYQIAVPELQIKDGETYALLGLVREGSVFRKATYNAKNDPEKFLIPIDLAGSYLYRATVFDLEYKVPMESLQGFGHK